MDHRRYINTFRAHRYNSQDYILMGILKMDLFVSECVNRSCNIFSVVLIAITKQKSIGQSVAIIDSISYGLSRVLQDIVSCYFESQLDQV